MIEFQCQCGRTFRIPDEYAGKKAKCPACERVFTIPEKASTSEGLIDSHGTGENAPHERKRAGLRSPRFLALAGILAVLLVAAIVITLTRRKGEAPEQVVVFQKVTPPPKESEDAAILPDEVEPKGETSQAETPSIESLPTEEQSAEQTVVEPTPAEGKYVTHEMAQVGEKAAQKVASLEEEPQSVGEPTPRAGSYAINLASFRDKERADRFVQELKKKGFEAFRWEVNLPGKGRWHRVSIGNFPTRKEAKDFVRQKKLKDKFRPFITRIPGA
jgi:cell division septation protein DedD